MQTSKFLHWIIFNIMMSKIIPRSKKLNFVTLSLQGEIFTMARVRYIFDNVIEELSIMQHIFCADSDIVHDKCFEAGIVKLTEEKAGILSYNEQKAVHIFKKVIPVINYSPKQESIVARACKRQKHNLLDSFAGYEDVRYILPASKICEWFYSISAIALDSRRQRLLPSHFQVQMFLFANSSHWSIQDISIIMFHESVSEMHE